jgi:hypothetical protein
MKPLLPTIEAMRAALLTTELRRSRGAVAGRGGQ